MHPADPAIVIQLVCRAKTIRINYLRFTQYLNTGQKQTRWHPRARVNSRNEFSSGTRQHQSRGVNIMKKKYQSFPPPCCQIPRSYPSRYLCRSPAAFSPNLSFACANEISASISHPRLKRLAAVTLFCGSEKVCSLVTATTGK